MSFTKPYTYVNGTTVTFTNQNANDDDARFAVNQETIAADYDDDAFDYDSIQRGELDVQVNSHQFTTGDIYGQSNLNDQVDRSYFTSETKANDQTGTASIQYQDLHETGTRFYMEANGALFFTFVTNTICSENISDASAPYNDGSHPGRIQ